MSRSDDIELDYDDGYPAGFTMLDNRDIWQERCKDLLLRPTTLGVWVAMVSLPRKWRFREEWLRRELHLGRDALRRALRELEDSGRLERRQYRGSKGEFTGCQWFLRRGGVSSRGNDPQPDLPPPENPSSAGPSPVDPPRLASTETTLSTETTPSTETTTSAELVPPPSLPSSALRQVVVLAEKSIQAGLAVDIAQQVLDELECSLRQPAAIRKPVSYVRTLFQRAHAGTFVPDGALKVERERREHMRILIAQANRLRDREIRAAGHADPTAREAGLRSLAEIGQRLGFAPRDFGGKSLS